MEYQLQGVEKLGGLRYCLIADDMGTGKTTTGIGTALRADTGGPYLVATPSLAVWKRELHECGIDPGLVHLGKDKDFFEALNYPLDDAWYIVNWEWLGTKPMLHSRRWGVVIADEVHKAKNRNARRTKGLKMLRCDTKIGLTGTPAHDKPQDIWSILNWFDKKRWSSYWRFVDDWIEWSEHYNGYREFFGVKLDRVHEFHAMLEPFYISRTIPLPPVHHVEVKCVLDAQHRREYDRMEEEAIARLDDQFALITETPLVVNTRLHQMASAGLVWNGTKTVKKYDKEMDEYFDSEVDQFKLVEPMPKLGGVVAICAAHAGSNGVAVYCAQVDTVRALQTRLDELGISYVFADAALGNSDEAASIFQSGGADVFISTTKYATEAIELVRTNVIVFADWKPWSHSDEAQIIGRIRRLSQQARECWAVYFLTENTVDYTRLEKIAAKKRNVEKLLPERQVVS